MNIVLIGNAISFVGCIMMVGIGLIKKKEHILKVQCVQFAVMSIANLVLGGVTGFISGMISIVRNLYFARKESTVAAKIIFIALQVVFSLGFVGDGIIGWFPVLAAMLYTWFLDLKSDVQFKIMSIAAQSFWVAYDLHNLNFVSFAFDIFTIISNLIGIYFIIRSMDREKDEVTSE